MADVLPHVVYVDCRGAVDAGGWFDELHPRGAGFGAAADRIIAAVQNVVGSGAAPRGMAVPGLTRPEPQALSLHVGLNEVDDRHYAGWKGELKGCETDVRAMKESADSEGWASSLMLTGDATREAVTESIRRAAATLKPGGQFLFTNASHGSQMKDFNGDEDTGKPDSTLCLYDCQLIDDELYDIWSRFAPGVWILMVSDSCHSGTVIRVGPQGYDPLATGLADIVPRSNRKGGPLVPRNMPSDVGRRVQEENEPLYRAIAGQYAHVDERIIMSPQQTSIRASRMLLGRPPG